MKVNHYCIAGKVVSRESMLITPSTRVKMEQDPRKERRLRKHFCKVCEYYPRIVTNATTRYNCRLCDKACFWGNDDHPFICVECGKERNVCCYCGLPMDKESEE